jgi:protein phosphatase
MMQMAVHSAQVPRETLEDAVAAFYLTRNTHDGKQDASVVVIADGVGGELFGEVASTTAVSVVSSRLAAAMTQGHLRPDPLRTPENLLKDALSEANAAVIEETTVRPHLKGMATTVVAALIMDGMAHVAWAGDSRCYICRLRDISQLTTDHSEVQRLVDAGMLRPREAKVHPSAHVINCFVGRADSFTAEGRSCRLLAGDMVLLCTDGLTDVLSDDEIFSWICRYRAGEITLKALPERIVRDAIDSGASDNVTVACCEYQSDVIRHETPERRITVTDAYAVEFARVVSRALEETSHV